MLYEYFVRALSIVFSKGKVSSKEIEENIDWFESIDFVRIEEIIEKIEKGIQYNQKFEDILADYMNELKDSKLINQKL